MSFKFDARFAIATAFSTQGGTLIGFEIQAVREEGEEDIIHCSDDEAEAWGIYARIQEPDGKAALAHWIADVDQQAQAQALCDILNHVQAELTKPATGEFVHPEFEATIETLDDTHSYDYSIEQTNVAPENFLLSIVGPDRELDFNYECREDAENDIRMAAKHFRIEFNSTDSTSIQG